MCVYKYYLAICLDLILLKIVYSYFFVPKVILFLYIHSFHIAQKHCRVLNLMILNELKKQFSMGILGELKTVLLEILRVQACVPIPLVVVSLAGVFLGLQLS